MFHVDPESRSGQLLLHRTEFHGQAECRATALVARRLKEDEGLVPQARLISGMYDTFHKEEFHQLPGI